MRLLDRRHRREEAVDWLRRGKRAGAAGAVAACLGSGYPAKSHYG